MEKGRIEFNDPTFRRREVVSKPGAALTVTKINLTDEERKGLSVNIRLSDLPKVKDVIEELRQENERLKAEIERLTA